MKKTTVSIGIFLLVIVASCTAMIGSVSASAPEIPDQPTGPSSGTGNMIYVFSVPGVDNSDGNTLYYLWDWGDGNTSLVGPFAPLEGPVVAEYNWFFPGEYEVKVKAINSVTDEESLFSPSATISIALEVPVIIADEEASVNEHVEFSINGIHTTDQHEVLYFFDFGDGFDTNWIGPFPSGEYETVEVYHKYDEKGYYTVKAKAKDSETGEESEWSEPHIMNIGHRFAIGTIGGGSGLSIPVENTLEPSKYANYTVEIVGGFPFFKVNQLHEDIIYIKSGTTEVVSIPAFFSLGRIQIRISVECFGQPETEIQKTATAFNLFSYTIIQSQEDV